MLANLGDVLAKRGIARRLVGAGAEARHLLDLDSGEVPAYQIERSATLAEVVDSFPGRARSRGGIRQTTMTAARRPTRGCRSPRLTPCSSCLFAPQEDPASEQHVNTARRAC